MSHNFALGDMFLRYHEDGGLQLIGLKPKHTAAVNTH